MVKGCSQECLSLRFLPGSSHKGIFPCQYGKGMQSRVSLSDSYLAVATRESPLSVNGVKGDVIFEEPRDSDCGTVKSSSQIGELSP